MSDIKSMLGIIEWQLRACSAPQSYFPSELETLKQKVATCTACELHQSRTQTVFGVGNTKAKLMIVGEAPGFYEDKQGEPFVGRAGQLLTRMLKSIGFNREDVYIANILKCRPPNNRDPILSEVDACTPFLEQQIKTIAPLIILAVGRISAQYLLKTKMSLENLRKNFHQYGENNIPLKVTYHPAYLLRQPQDKKKAFFDLKELQQFLMTKGIETHGSLSECSVLTL